MGDIVPEGFADIFIGCFCVFDDIVEQGGDDGVGVEFEVSEDFGDREGVCPVWDAGAALLLAVVLHASLDGFLQPFSDGFAGVGADLFDHGFCGF